MLRTKKRIYFSIHSNASEKRRELNTGFQVIQVLCKSMKKQVIDDSALYNIAVWLGYENTNTLHCKPIVIHCRARLADELWSKTIALHSLVHLISCYCYLVLSNEIPAALVSSDTTSLLTYHLDAVFLTTILSVSSAVAATSSFWTPIKCCVSGSL